VFLILILFLGSPRSALRGRVTHPAGAGVGVLAAQSHHVSANLLSLGAIDFGILVDGAIVVTEAVLRRREAMPDEELSEARPRPRRCR
jgi:heavy metal efflux system protein